MRKILIITGPTASGKTNLALRCAKQLDGEIISADSMQVYRHLNIGTAKITKLEMQGIRHHLIDVVNPDQEFSVGQFVTLARDIIEDIFSRNKVPIIVGGTGLYIKSLIYPYTFASTPKNNDVRQKYKDLLEKNGQDYLYNLLKQKDSIASQKVHPNDTKRVIRALEIIELSGKTKSEQNLENITPAYDYLLVAIDLDRQVLYDRINKRVDNMFNSGLVSEVKKLIESKLVTFDCQSMQAIGYKEFKDYFNGTIGLSQLKDLIKQHSRNYAKRQLTFIRGFDNVLWLKNIEEIEQTLIHIKKQFKGETK